MSLAPPAPLLRRPSLLVGHKHTFSSVDSEETRRRARLAISSQKALFNPKMLQNIFQFFDVQSMVRASMVCRAWYLSLNDDMWEILAKRRWPHRSKAPDETWKEFVLLMFGFEYLLM